MKLAVAGLGNMGHALAERLLDGGHELTVWNRSADKGDDLVARGARRAATPAAAADGAQAIFISLADDAAVLAVFAGESGVAAGLSAGSGDGRSAILVDTSTVSPVTSARLAEAVAGRFISSPILGAPAAVRSGLAGYLIAGPPALYEALAPAYAALADEGRRRFLGEDPAVPLTLKLLSNYLLMSGIAALAEVVATAQAAGLPDELLQEYLGEAPLVAPALRNRLAAIIAGEHDGWFSTTLGAKDVRLARELAGSHDVMLPLAELVQRRYEQAAAEGWASADISAVVELVRAAARPG